MRSVLLVAAFCGLAVAPAFFVPALAPANAAAAEIRVISPGVISNSGLSEVKAAFEKKTGVKVIIQVDGMGTIMNDTRTQDPGRRRGDAAHGPDGGHGAVGRTDP